MKVLSFDPSGNKGAEGEGTTGWALFNDGKLEDFGDIKASDYDSQEEYWKFHRDLIMEQWPDVCVIESYRLFESKAQSQSWSTLDTPQLIGYMRMVCFDFKIPVVFQDPAQKAGVKDDRLVKLGYLEKANNRYYALGIMTNLHQRDAIRHGIYYHRYGKGKLGNG